MRRQPCPRGAWRKVLGSSPPAAWNDRLRLALAGGAKLPVPTFWLLANTGADAINAVKQAAGIWSDQQRRAVGGLVQTLSDVDFLGLPPARGLLLTEAFYWDLK